MWRSRSGVAAARGSQGEDGIALIEAVGALTILAVGFVALGAGLTVGFRQIAEARQRQAAAQVATSRLEHLRNLPYANVALSAALTHSNDPLHPDYYVSADGTSYDVEGDGQSYETLIVQSDGLVSHEEPPVTVGTTQVKTYLFVTWVDDPNLPGTQNYRRITTVQVVLNPASPGSPRMTRSSSLFTTGVVSYGGGQTPGAQQGSPVPAPTNPGAGVPTNCPDILDTTAPQGEFEIVAGSAEVGFTASTEVTLRFVGVSDQCLPIKLRFSNDNTVFGNDATYVATNPAVGWAVPGGDGVKTVYGKIRDGLNNQRNMTQRTVTLDETKPTTPGTLSHSSITCSGNNRTVNLQWGSSTDTNFRGYRLYRSVNGGAFIELKTTSSLSLSDTHAKGLDSVRFYVVGYDRAGNESPATNTVAYARNRCS